MHPVSAMIHVPKAAGPTSGAYFEDDDEWAGYFDRGVSQLAVGSRRGNHREIVDPFAASPALTTTPTSATRRRQSLV